MKDSPRANEGRSKIVRSLTICPIDIKHAAPSVRNKTRLVDIEVQAFQNVVTAAYSGARALAGEGFE
jgi:hypothetical protein